MDRGVQKHLSVGTARGLLQVVWPHFIEVNDCVLAASNGGELLGLGQT